MEDIRKMKVPLIDALMSDPDYILQHFQQENLITQREYTNVRSFRQFPEAQVIYLLDNVMDKGEEACCRFLSLLQRPEVQDTFPHLKKLCSGAATDVDIRQQTVSKRPGAPLLSSTAAASDYSPEGKRTRTMDMEPGSEAQLGGAQSMILNASVLNSNHQELETEKNKSALRLQQKLKKSLKEKYEYICEGVATSGKHALFNSIYTELYITEGDCEGVNNEHEVWQIETANRRHPTQDKSIKCNNIFKPLSGQEIPIRTVLTKGIAGIGKTFSVQKFIIDWANGEANQDVEFMFVLPFRHLNLFHDEQYSLLKLLLDFYPEMKDFENIEFGKHKVLFIFDGLDESRLKLNFRGNKILKDATKTASVDRLLTNLITGELLPSALLWITSRPAAANKIPTLPNRPQRLTEIRGFKDEQKEVYFRNRFPDENLADRVISHIKTSRSLYIMCHIPVFCWISASVLEQFLCHTDSGEIPKSQTELYSHFLLIQSSLKNEKYEDESEKESKKLLESNKDILLKLGQLAFQHLKKGNLMFYEEDLINCGIDVTEASVHSGLCTEIFKKESLLGNKKVYYFVHLSLQEYLAALYVIHSFTDKNYDALKYFFGKMTLTKELSLHDLHRKAVQKALKSKNGHLDLFLRFLLGLSLDSSQRLLQGLLTQTASNLESIQKTVEYIKGLKTKNPSPERCINLLHCLSELKDDSLVKEIQKYLSSGNPSGEKISPAHCSALAYELLMSEKELDEFDLRKYNTSEEGRQRLVPAVKCCRKAVLAGCNLTEKSCETVAAALQLDFCPLIELDISNNNLGNTGVKWLYAALKSPNCKLQILDLSHNDLGDTGVEWVCAGLKSPNCKLQSLALSYNKLECKGVKLLCDALILAHCKIHTLRFSGCYLDEEFCKSVISVLQSGLSPLRELTIRELTISNINTDSAVELLRVTLMSPDCKLQMLSLGCNLTEKSCELVISILQSTTSPLRELVISKNKFGDSGVKLLCAGITSQNCKPQTLDLSYCNLGNSAANLLCVGLLSQNCKLQTLRLGWCNLTEGCCDDLSKILRSPHSELRDLELRDIGLQDLGVIALSAGLEDSQCKLQRLGLSGCQVTERGCASLASALCSNPSHLMELDLSYNHPGESGVRALSAVLEDPSCRLETLLVDHGGENRTKPGPRKYGCQLTLDPNTAHRALSLSEGNRKVTHALGRVEPYPDHPERFDYWTQVVCRESVCERCYWEAEFSEPGEWGEVHIAVTDKGISRKGGSFDCGFGLNKNSWSLRFCEGGSDKLSYSVWHNENQTPIPAPLSPYHRAAVCDGDDDGKGVCVYRVGVCVDRPAGTLSFYSVSDSDTPTLLHRVHTHFTQHTPLCAGFRVKNSSLSLCQLE